MNAQIANNNTSEKIMISESTSSGPSRLRRLTDYIGQDPANLSLRSDVFDQAMREGALEVAEQQIQYVTVYGVQSAAWQNRLAVLRIAQGRLEEADNVLSGLLAQGHQEAGIVYNRAYIAFHCGQYEVARQACSSLLEKPEAPLQTLALWLRCMHHLGDVQEALARAEMFANQGRLDAIAAGVASLIAVDAGKFESGQKWAEMALRIDADHLEALVAVGSIALAFRKQEVSMQSFQRALAFSPSDGRSWSGMGTAYMLAKDLENARKCFTQALTSLPQHIGTWHGLGWCSILSNQLTEAQRCFDQALDLDRNFAESHGGLAVVLALQGFPERAGEHIERALRLDPRCLSPRYAQAVIDGDTTDVARFEVVARRVLKDHAAPDGIALSTLLFQH